MLNKHKKKAYYIQIAETLESMIRSGYFCYGQKLPTLTDMKTIYNISLKVAAQAYERLNDMGLIYSVRGKGYFVSSHHRLSIDLDDIHQLEYQLVYEYKMKKEIILYEIIEMNRYIAQIFNLKEHTKCYHIKQYYGNNNQNVLLQELYMPVAYYPDLEPKLSIFLTTPSLVMNGYRYSVDEFLNHFFASQASAEHEMFLKIKQGEPIWRIETTYLSETQQPIVFMNQYLSGEFVEMAVMIDVD